MKGSSRGQRRHYALRPNADVARFIACGQPSITCDPVITDIYILHCISYNVIYRYSIRDVVRFSASDNYRPQQPHRDGISVGYRTNSDIITSVRREYNGMHKSLRERQFFRFCWNIPLTQKAFCHYKWEEVGRSGGTNLRYAA